MKCPVCKTELKVTGHSQYETLSEHVSDPNQETYPKRAEYTCPNRCYGRRVFWGVDGGAYVRPHWIQKLLWKFNIYGVIKDPNPKDVYYEEGD